ncbi:hypothetical protein ADK57_40870 [Streptomyces sp. MMG1533]|uniref:hypothetical protein n=1 Tax=Streptomyces sp. MMG1533 TaxID=1415546 RepID=UPI0006AFE914|nr:hypothetical protein [Streptomyces sp. MMG1533]KOU56782.1 hypothetical protein ADK57_40870 [Streptomyces sp. MMG1533]
MGPEGGRGDGGRAGAFAHALALALGEILEPAHPLRGIGAAPLSDGVETCTRTYGGAPTR